ncbi:universal stress family protein [filamentous cyanobacterium CCP1]|nr:universal stress family protein [filamentous cyanobacterium CCP2]PSB62519.1 universal stress family protein [filamentous cyanobacterium CCP1]
MNIQAILLQLQNALGQTNLSRQMLLYPGLAASDPWVETPIADETPSQSIEPAEQAANFVVGYSGSPNSQTALDFVFWMAHQARLTLQRPVTVHVVYVLDSCHSLNTSCVAASSLSELRTQFSTVSQAQPSLRAANRSRTAVLTRSETEPLADSQLVTSISLTSSLEYADRILWQARCLADEWRGSLEAHLRFGSVTSELRQVVEAVNADLLFVGCSSPDHALLQHFPSEFPCPILGIPTELEAEPNQDN